ncbi:MAG: hypothetical protein IPL65_05745 [Lewinellaceae bacterium]|nr:hypothetical protein [Lewinellaceae bacterium]
MAATYLAAGGTTNRIGYHHAAGSPAVEKRKKYPEASLVFNRTFTQLSTGSNAQALTDCCYHWADCLLTQGKTDSALLLFEQAIFHGKKVRDYEKLMFAYSVLGEVNRLRGHHRKALAYNLECARFCQLFGDQSQYSSRLSIIGSNYLGLLRTDSAYYYYREAVRIKTAIGDTALLSIAFDHLGVYYQKIGERGKATEAYLNSLKAAETAGNPAQISTELINLAEILLEEGQLAYARPYAERALLMTDTLGLHFTQGRVLNILSELSNATGQETQRIAYLEQALRIYLDRNNQPAIAIQYLRLAQAYTHKGILQKPAILPFRA